MLGPCDLGRSISCMSIPKAREIGKSNSESPESATRVVMSVPSVVIPIRESSSASERPAIARTKQKVIAKVSFMSSSRDLWPLLLAVRQRFPQERCVWITFCRITAAVTEDGQCVFYLQTPHAVLMVTRIPSLIGCPQWEPCRARNAGHPK